MARYRKKPVVIEAEQFLQDRFDRTEYLPPGVCDCGFLTTVHCHTLEGPLAVRHLDWIVKGVQGEFYPVKDEIFALTYEPAPDSEAS